MKKSYHPLTSTFITQAEVCLPRRSWKLNMTEFEHCLSLKLKLLLRGKDVISLEPILFVCIFICVMDMQNKQGNIENGQENSFSVT